MAHVEQPAYASARGLGLAMGDIMTIAWGLALVVAGAVVGMTIRHHSLPVVGVVSGAVLLTWFGAGHGFPILGVLLPFVLAYAPARIISKLFFGYSRNESAPTRGADDQEAETAAGRNLQSGGNGQAKRTGQRP